MPAYEMVTLLHPRLDEEGVAQLSEWLQGRITDLGGEVIAVVPWGRRTLAYGIDKHTEANYVQYDFRLQGTQLKELTRLLALNEDVLRQLPVRKSDR